MSLLPNPFFSDFDGFFDRMLPGRLSGGPELASNMPLVDIKETDNAIEMRADLPGVEKEDINVEINGNLLTISARHSEENEEKDGGKVIRKERRTNSYARTFTLGDSIETNDIRADFKNGVLLLTMPKIHESIAKEKTKKIPIGQ